MSLKIKFKDELWTKVLDGDYKYDITPITGVEDFDWSTTPSLKMSIHPGWLSLMDQLEVGDIVTTHKQDIGVITKVYEITSLGMKKYEVLIGNEKEVFFSINLKKVEENKVKE
tara:strand:- start:39 stop:377 length:339 start_codon:yes stop_codon:yes gene_type:complete